MRDLTLNADFLAETRKPGLSLAMCWEIVTIGGVTLRFTNWDKEITTDVDGSPETFVPTSAFSPTALGQKNSLAVDNLNLLGVTSADITEADLRAGLYSDATVRLWLCATSHVDYPLLALRKGTLGEVISRGSEFEVEFRSLSHRLQRSIGRFWTTECDATFGDARCSLDLSSFTFTGTVAAVTNRRNMEITLSGGDQALNYFRYGTVEWTSGQNDGVKIEVLGSSADTVLYLLYPTPFAVEVGDTVTLVRGCPKTMDFCVSLSNLINYRGFPHIPVEEERFRTPNVRT